MYASLGGASVALYVSMLKAPRAVVGLGVLGDRKSRPSPIEGCCEAGVVGVGWGVGSVMLDWLSRGERVIAVVHAAVGEFDDFPSGSLIWTRDPFSGDYHVALVIGPWRYLRRAAAVGAGIQKVGPVRIVACEPVSHVPSRIVDHVISAWAIQRSRDDATPRRQRLAIPAGGL